MRATGIVRRIDDLGRVVIPKEIRRTQLIRVGDPLEIFVSGDGEVVFKKYSPLGELATSAQSMADVLYKTSGKPVVVTDRDRVLAAAGSRETQDRPLTPQYTQTMEQRRYFAAALGSPVALCDAGGNYAAAVMPILSSGDLVGSVAMLGDGILDQQDETLLRMAAGYLGRQLEE